MCKYCHTDRNNEKIYKGKASSIGIIRQTFFDVKIYVLYTQLLEHDTSFLVTINYCPMCGRKLGE